MIYTKTKRNQYDVGIILSIALLSFGGYGGSFQPIRVLSILFIPYVLSYLARPKYNKKEFIFVLFFVSWFFYGALSLTWTLNRAEGLKHLFYIAIHASLFFQLIMWAKKSNQPLHSIMIGWVSILVITLPIALYEITTLNHLSISRFDSDKMINLGGLVTNYRFASTTFSNSNTYVVILCFCLPFLMASYWQSKKLTSKYVLAVIFLFSCFVLFVNASRGGVLCLILYLLVYFYCFSSIKSKIKKNNILLLLLALPALLALIYMGIDSIYPYLDRFFFKFFDGDKTKIVSDSSRTSIYLAGLEAFKNSYFLGTGAGSQQDAFLAINKTIVTASHNILIEMLLQYGAVLTLLFGVYLINVFTPAVCQNSLNNKFIRLCFLISFPILFIINSTYLLMPSVWILFACVYIVSQSKTIKSDK